MLLTQKSLIEGARALSGLRACRWIARCITRTPRSASEAEALLSLLTPIVKGFVTGMSLECTSMRSRSTAGTATSARPASSSSSAMRASRDLRGRERRAGDGPARPEGARLRRRARAAARRPDRRFLRAPRGRGEHAEFIVRLAGLLKEWSVATEEIAGARAKSRRDRRSLDGLPAAHRLSLPCLVLGLDGVGLGRGARSQAAPTPHSTAPSSRPRASTSSASCRAPRRISTRWARAPGR